jgi:Tol biopolymer transport system component
VPGQVDALRPNGANLDLFLYDRAARKTTLVSHTAASPLTTGDGGSNAPALSANGSRLVFTSGADNLVGDLADRNGAPDLFAYDVATRSLDAVTRHAEGLPALSPDASSHARALSADGRWLAYESDSAHIITGQQDTNGKSDVFLYDATARTTVLVSHVPSSATTAPQGASSQPAVSADGRWVAFVSDARNLVPGANPASQPCVFLWDRTTGGVTFVARTGSFAGPSSSTAPRISPDGRWIAFVSSASDLIPGQQDPGTLPGTILNVFLWDRLTQALTLVSHAASDPLVEGSHDSDMPVLSDDGRFVAFHSAAGGLVPGQTREGDDLFLFDRTTGSIVLVSRTRSSATEPGGAFSPPVLSADGRFLLFTSFAGGLDPGASSGDVNVYLYDASLKTYQQISAEGTPNRQLSLNADSRFAAFCSGKQIYLYDRVAKTLALASHTPDGFSSNGDADAPAVSADGRYVAFVSDASDLMAGQVQAPGRVSSEVSAYLYDRTSGQVTLLSRWQGSPTTAAGGAGDLLISADGQRIAFDSGIDLLSGDFNRRTDAYLFRLDGGSTGGGGPVTLPPCLLFDTHRPADGPALRSNVARVVKATGLCGVPATAARVTVKLTAFGGTGKGNVRLYPGDLAQPAVGILRFSRGQTVTATFDAPVAPNAGTLTLLPFVAGNGTAGVSVEVDGYTP